MYEWHDIDYKKAAELVKNRDPNVFSLGYYSNDKWPQSGIGSFSWFSSQEELLDYLVNIETQIWSYDFDGLDEERYMEQKSMIQKSIKVLDSNKQLTNSLRKRINEQLIGWEIGWWGNFSDLCSGRDMFSRELIEWFYNYHGEYSEINKPKTIRKEYVPEYVKYLKDFGH